MAAKSAISFKAASGTHLSQQLSFILTKINCFLFFTFRRCFCSSPSRLANELLIIKSQSQCQGKDACVRSSKINDSCTWLMICIYFCDFSAYDSHGLYMVKNSIKENEENKVQAVNKMRIGCENWGIFTSQMPLSRLMWMTCL